jgi:hypothetical protein
LDRDEIARLRLENLALKQELMRREVEQNGPLAAVEMIRRFERGEFAVPRP